MTETIRINAGKGYDVKIGPGLLQKAGDLAGAGDAAGEKSRTFHRFGCRRAVCGYRGRKFPTSGV